MKNFVRGKNLRWGEFTNLTDSETAKGILILCLLILVGVIIGYLILRFPLPQTLALILGMGLLGVSIYKIEFPFYIYVFLLIVLVQVSPIEGSIFKYITERDYPGIPSLLEIAIGLLWLSFLIRLFLQRNKSLVSPLNLPFMIFLGLLAISFCVGYQNVVDELTLKEDVKKFLVPALFFICCVNFLDSKKKISFLMVSIFTVAFIKSSLGVVYYLKGLGFVYESSQTVVFLDTADHLIFVTVTLVFISFIISNKLYGFKLLVGLFAISPMLFSLIFSYRRTSWLGFLLSLAFLFFLVPGRRKLKMLTIGTCLGLIIVLLISSSNFVQSLPSQKFLGNRFVSIFDSRQDSNVAHFTEWTITFEDTIKQPILGLGLGSRHRPVPGYETLETDIVHNAFLMLWMKMGIFTFIFFLWCLIRYLKFGTRAARSKEASGVKPLQAGLFSSVGFWVVSLNVGPTWFYYRETCLMALVAAMVLNIPRCIENLQNTLSEQ